jgi:hypothetical protein
MSVEAQPMPVVDQVVTREAAPAALEQLRADRFNGKVSEDHFNKRGDYIRSVMDGKPGEAPPAPPKAVETIEERFDRDYAEHMTAPRPELYNNLPSAEFFGDRAREFDVGMTRVLSRAGIPQAYAPTLLENTYRDLIELTESGAEALSARVSSVKAELMTRWGDDYQRRLDAVDDLLADAVEADPTVAHTFERAPWIFACSLWSMESLDRVASHRASARR